MIRISAKAQKTAARVLFIALAAIIALVIIFPFIWMLPSSLKGRESIWSIPPQWWPDKLEWSNFAALTEKDINGGYFFRSVLATLVVGVSATFLNMAINILAAYGFARHEFPGKRVLWMLVLFTMFVPGITVQITSAYFRRICSAPTPSSSFSSSTRMRSGAIFPSSPRF